MQRRFEVVVQDLSFFLDPKLTNENFSTAQGTMKCLQKFVLPDQKPGITHTENALEFIRACEDLYWIHDKSTPFRSETNGIAKHAARGVKVGTATPRLQSGLSESGGEAMECFCYFRNTQDKLTDRKSQYENNFGTPHDGSVIPSGV